MIINIFIIMRRDTCLRCGKKYNNYKTLYSHYTKNKLCEVKYLDINYEEMRKNYREYYIIYGVIKENDYEQINQEIEEKNNIQICNINYNINHIINNKTKNIQNNTTIGQQNVIKINRFGYDDHKFIKNKHMYQALKNPRNGIPKLVEKVNFNKKYPQNHNIKLENKTDKYYKVFNGNKWVYSGKQEVIDSLLSKKKDMLDDFYELHKNNKKIKKYFIKDYQKFSDNFDLYINFFLGNKIVSKEKAKEITKLYNELKKEVEKIIFINMEIEENENDDSSESDIEL